MDVYAKPMEYLEMCYMLAYSIAQFPFLEFQVR